MSRSTYLAVSGLLCLVWLVLTVFSGVDHWGWGWTAFFAFAAGERWSECGRASR